MRHRISNRITLRLAALALPALIVLLALQLGCEKNPIGPVAREYYYWGNGEKIVIYENLSGIIFIYKAGEPRADLQALLNNSNVSKVSSWDDGRLVMLELSRTQREPIPKLLAELLVPLSSLESYRFGLVYPDGTLLWLTDEILLRLKQEYSLEDLEAMIEGDAIHQETRMYSIKLKVTDINNVLSLANKIYESGIAVWSQPNFIAEIILLDRFYPEHYPLQSATPTPSTQ